MVRVKICGLTNRQDVEAAIAAGADALGFVLAESPRRVDPDQVRAMTAGLPPFVTTIGVVVEPEASALPGLCLYCGLDGIQIHGRFDFNSLPKMNGRAGFKLIRAVSVTPKTRAAELGPSVHPAQTLLLDAFSPDKHGGTGRTFDWGLAREAARYRPIILAGGLNPENIKEAVATVRPFGVDASSGLETEPGRKDHDRVREFIRRAKSLD